MVVVVVVVVGAAVVVVVVVVVGGGSVGNFIGAKCKLSVKFDCAPASATNASAPNKIMANFIFFLLGFTSIRSISIFDQI